MENVTKHPLLNRTELYKPVQGGPQWNVEYYVIATTTNYPTRKTNTQHKPALAVIIFVLLQWLYLQHHWMPIEIQALDVNTYIIIMIFFSIHWMKYFFSAFKTKETNLHETLNKSEMFYCANFFQLMIFSHFCFILSLFILYFFDHPFLPTYKWWYLKPVNERVTELSILYHSYAT